MSSSKVKQNLVSIFYQTLKPAPPRERKPSDFNVKPSEAGAKCLRKIYYGTFKVPKDFDVPANVKKMGKMGDGVGHLLSNTYRDQGILVDYIDENGNIPILRGAPNLEFPIECPELGIKKGFIDAVYIMDGELWLGENKTCTDTSFKKLNKPKPNHLTQGVIYLFVFNKMLKEGRFKHIKPLQNFTEAKGIRFLYVDRNNCVEFPMKEFIVTTQEALPTFQKLVSKVTTLLEYTAKRELPPTTQDWCNSCDWRAKCSKNYNVE